MIKNPIRGKPKGGSVSVSLPKSKISHINASLSLYFKFSIMEKIKKENRVSPQIFYVC